MPQPCSSPPYTNNHHILSLSIYFVMLEALAEGGDLLINHWH
jgi:hypothetical protein